MKIALGTLQDEFQLSGEYQIFYGWFERLRRGSASVRAFSPVGERLRGADFKNDLHGETLWKKWHELSLFTQEACRIAREVDVLHLFLPTPNFLWVADRIKRRTKKKVVVTCLGEKPKASSRRLFSDLVRSPRFFGVRYLSSLLLPNASFGCDLYIAGSGVVGSQLIAAGCPRERVQVIAPLLPAESISFVEPPESLVEKMKRHPTVLYVGHFLPNKGVDRVLRAFSELSLPNARLLLVWSGLGNGRAMDTLIAALGIADRTEIISRPIRLSSLFAHARALVLPYQSALGQTSPPLIVLEAYRTGVPVLIPPLPVMSEWGEDRKHYATIDPKNPKQMSRTLDLFLRDATIGSSMRDAQRALFAERRDPIQPLELYERIV